MELSSISVQEDLANLILLKNIKEEIEDGTACKVVDTTDNIKKECTLECEKMFSNPMEPVVKIEEIEEISELAKMYNGGSTDFTINNKEVDRKKEFSGSTETSKEEQKVAANDTFQQFQHRIVPKRQKHQNDKVDMFKCDQCDFQTIHKRSLQIHLLRHKNPEEINMFKCDQCDFQTIRKTYLNRHYLRHKNPEEVNVFKCDQCDFQTIRKSYLKRRHYLRHKTPEEGNMFKCDQCDFQTICKRYLTKHHVPHKKPEEVNKFKCDQCDFQTIHKRSLKIHLLRHHDPEDVHMLNKQCTKII